MGKLPIAIRFGRVVRRLRTAAGHSQEEFASLVGIHRTYQGAVERGEKTVTIETADKFAHALALSLPELFSELEREPWSDVDTKPTRSSG